MVTLEIRSENRTKSVWKYSRLVRIVALIPYETLNLFKLYKIFITLTRALNLKFIKPGSYLKIDAFWGFSGYESMFFHMFFLAALTRVSASGNLSFLDFFELSGCQYRYKLTIFNEINPLSGQPSV